MAEMVAQGDDHLFPELLSPTLPLQKKTGDLVFFLWTMVC